METKGSLPLLQKPATCPYPRHIIQVHAPPPTQLPEDQF